MNGGEILLFVIVVWENSKSLDDDSKINDDDTVFLALQLL